MNFEKTEFDSIIAKLFKTRNNVTSGFDKITHVSGGFNYEVSCDIIPFEELYKQASKSCKNCLGRGRVTRHFDIRKYNMTWCKVIVNDVETLMKPDLYKELLEKAGKEILGEDKDKNIVVLGKNPSDFRVVTTCGCVEKHLPEEYLHNKFRTEWYKIFIDKKDAAVSPDSSVEVNSKSA